MQIDEAIRQTREFAKIMRELGDKYAKEDKRSLAAETAFQDAEALETVCNEVETLRETCRGYAKAMTSQDSGQIRPESDESGDVGEMLGWK